MNTNSTCRYILLLSAYTALVVLGFAGCRNPDSAGLSRQATLSFSLTLDPSVYSQTRYKKPPQFAVWIENLAGSQIRTVWVTDKTGTGSWGGKTTRPVALPYWTSRWRRETLSSGLPNPANPVVDAATGATPKQDLNCQVKVPAGSTWNCFVEVNASGDYNETFAEKLKDGTRDKNGNGQPSIVYKGKIKAVPGKKCVPRLAGRTDQLEEIDHMIPDTTSITTAANLLSKIEVVCE